MAQETQETRKLIETKDELYCHAIPIMKGLEEAGEDMEETRAQIVVLGQMLQDGDITPEDLTESLNRTFGRKAVDEAAKVCALHAEEILEDAQTMEDKVAQCQPCLDKALQSIVVEQDQSGGNESPDGSPEENSEEGGS